MERFLPFIAELPPLSLGRDQSAVGKQYPEFRDLYQQKKSYFGTDANAMTEENCDPSYLEDLVPKIKEYYRHYNTK